MTDRVKRLQRTSGQHDPPNYGRIWAPFYDKIFTVVEDYTIDLLASLAGDPPRALELAVGTGRIALPLAERGVAVTGIDISEEMVSILASKPKGEEVEIVVGDMAEVPVDGEFPLIYLAFNTLFALLTQERQVECFQNVATHLAPGGRFVIDCFVPDLGRFDSAHTRMGVVSLGEDGAHAYELSVHDPVRQQVASQHVRRAADGSTVVLPVTVRYAWPAELDLMARIAGLELEHRWGWYDRRPFNEASGQHVSVYRKGA